MTEPPVAVSHAHDPARAAILDAARGTAQTDLGKPVRFVVEQLARHGEWAFLRALMQDLHGRRIDLADSKLAEAAAQGMASDRYAALLHHVGRSWTVIVHATGPTDAVWETWASEYGAPPALFPR